MYEVGTGNVASEIRSVFSISEAKFSPDGKYLALGANNGAVSVWAIGQHLYQNMRSIMDQMEVNPDFWSNFPIFLDNYQGLPHEQNFALSPVGPPPELPPVYISQSPQRDHQSDYMNSNAKMSTAGKIIVPDLPDYQSNFNYQNQPGLQGGSGAPGGGIPPQKVPEFVQPMQNMDQYFDNQ